MKIFAAICLTLAVAGAILTQGGYFGALAILSATIWTLVLLGLWLLVNVLCIAPRERHRFFRPAITVWTVLLVAGLIFFSGRNALAAYRVASARAYADRAIEMIEATKSTTGHYPAQIPLDQLGPPPALVTSESFQSDGATFHFVIGNPTQIFECSQFDSTRRQWALIN